MAAADRRGGGKGAGTPRRRPRAVHAPPAGFRYLPEFVTPEEEQRLVTAIAALAFEPVRMRGFEAKRQVVHYGARYSYDGAELAPAEAPPEFLADVCARASAAARFPAGSAIEALVTRYPPGAAIGWHRDAPPFGPSVAGLSLAGGCELRMRRETPGGYDVYKERVEPRSLYVIAGTARFRWQHAIPPVPALRYSVTFRTIRSGSAGRRAVTGRV